MAAKATKRGVVGLVSQVVCPDGGVRDIKVSEIEDGLGAKALRVDRVRALAVKSLAFATGVHEKFLHGQAGAGTEGDEYVGSEDLVAEWLECYPDGVADCAAPVAILYARFMAHWLAINRTEDAESGSVAKVREAQCDVARVALVAAAEDLLRFCDSINGAVIRF